MGRWGDGNLESDSGLDYQAGLLMDVVKDIMFGLSPHYHPRFHLRHALQTLEAADLLVRVCEYYNAFLEIPSQTVRNWAEAYLTLFDQAQNQPPEYQYARLVTIKRESIVAVFARLEAITRRSDDLWDESLKLPDELMDIKPGPRIFELPPDGGAYAAQFIRILVHDISFGLAPENMSKFSSGQNIEHMRVDMDMLAFLGSEYEYGVGRNAPTIRYWRGIFLKTYDALMLKQNPRYPAFIEKSEERRIIVETFDKLEALAQQYPAWSDDYSEPE